MSADILKIAEIFINGGLAYGLIKASMMLGEIAVKMENRMTALETDVGWLKRAHGRRVSDGGE